MNQVIHTNGSPLPIVVLLGEIEARSLVAEIRSNMDGIRDRVFRLYEGEGWRALGYPSWRSCVKEEFPKGQSTLYQELAAAKVERAISAIAEKPVSLQESHARQLAKLKEPEKQADAWKEAVETAPDGKVTAKHVAQVVRRKLPGKATSLPRPEITGQTEHARPERATFPVARLQALDDARAADVSLQNWASIQATIEKELTSPEMRKAIFLVRGGELALLRLELDWTVTPEQLKSAYKRAALSAHPDRGGSQEEFCAVQRSRDLVAQMLGIGAGGDR